MNDEYSDMKSQLFATKTASIQKEQEQTENINELEGHVNFYKEKY